MLPGSAGHSLLALNDNLNSGSGATLLDDGHHLSTAATAAVGLADMRLFDGTRAAIGVKVITEPTLIGVATGNAATSYVIYTSPVLDVTLPGGISAHLDGVHTNIDVVTPSAAGAVAALLGSLGLPVASVLPPLGTQLELRLTVGAATTHVSADSVSGTAASLRVQVLLVPGDMSDGIVAHAVKNATPVLDLGIGVLSVAASARDHRVPVKSASPTVSPSANPVVPTAGTSTSPSTSTPPSRSTPPSPVTVAANLPLTGSRSAWFIAAGILILAGGRFLLVVSRRRTSS